METTSWRRPFVQLKPVKTCTKSFTGEIFNCYQQFPTSCFPNLNNANQCQFQSLTVVKHCQSMMCPTAAWCGKTMKLVENTWNSGREVTKSFLRVEVVNSQSLPFIMGGCQPVQGVLASGGIAVLRWSKLLIFYTQHPLFLPVSQHLQWESDGGL